MLAEESAPSPLSPSQQPRARYYPALDGLRALALIMVFCQHYGSARVCILGWGWTGVDIFFVLSGFLITGILFDSRDKPNRYRDFYARRTLRIFPLFYAVWLVILLMAPIARWQWDWHWALWPAYLGNYARFLFHPGAGDSYTFDRLTFGPAVQSFFGSPMHLWVNHFWSLCVEEQFYLLWPFLVYTVRRRSTLIRICSAVILCLPLLRWLVTLAVSPRLLAMELLYRSLPTRLDALLLGGLVALLLRGPEHALLHRWRRPILLATSLLFCAAYLIAVKTMHLPLHGSATNWIAIFGFTLIDLFAAALILECIHPGSPLGRLLAIRPLRGLGIISYGLYVYHDLFHDFFGYLASRFFAPYAFAATAVIAFVGTTAIATASYFVLERPLLRLKSRFAGQVHRAPTV